MQESLAGTTHVALLAEQLNLATRRVAPSAEELAALRCLS